MWTWDIWIQVEDVYGETKSFVARHLQPTWQNPSYGTSLASLESWIIRLFRTPGDREFLWRHNLGDNHGGAGRHNGDHSAVPEDGQPRWDQCWCWCWRTTSVRSTLLLSILLFNAMLMSLRESYSFQLVAEVWKWFWNWVSWDFEIDVSTTKEWDTYLQVIMWTFDNPEAKCLGLNVLFDVFSVCPYFAHILNFARWWSFQGWLCQTALNNLKWPQTVANSSTVIGQQIKSEINFHYERVKAIFLFCLALSSTRKVLLLHPECLYFCSKFAHLHRNSMPVRRIDHTFFCIKTVCPLPAFS